MEIAKSYIITAKTVSVGEGRNQLLMVQTNGSSQRNASAAYETGGVIEREKPLFYLRTTSSQSSRLAN